MSNTPVWVTFDQVVAQNDAIVAFKGEPFGVADPGHLDAALNRPRIAAIYGEPDEVDDIVLLGALLCIAISEAQAFRQGNKRTGVAAMELFFRQNGYTLSGCPRLLIADLVLASAHEDHYARLDARGFADAIDDYVVPIEEAIADGDFMGSIDAAFEQRATEDDTACLPGKWGVRASAGFPDDL